MGGVSLATPALDIVHVQLQDSDTQVKLLIPAAGYSWGASSPPSSHAPVCILRLRSAGRRPPPADDDDDGAPAPMNCTLGLGRRRRAGLPLAFPVPAAAPPPARRARCARALASAWSSSSQITSTEPSRRESGGCEIIFKLACSVVSSGGRSAPHLSLMHDRCSRGGPRANALASPRRGSGGIGAGSGSGAGSLSAGAAAASAEGGAAVPAPSSPSSQGGSAARQSPSK
jgi:hypothetical protein